MLKKFIATFLSIILIFDALPIINVTAESDSGTCGDNLTWSFNIDSGMLTISGSGAMTNYNSNTNLAPWSPYRNQIKEIMIGGEVTTIGSYSFANCAALTSIEIPKNIKAIWYHAFYNCGMLSEVALNEGLELIGYSAFRKTVLEEIIIPKSVKSLTFDRYSSNGEPINFSNNYSYVSAFYESKLKKVIFADGTNSIKYDSFYNCTSLKEVIIPNSVTHIGEYAFYGCTNLALIDLPKSIKAIEQYAFYNCVKLTNVILPDNIDRIQTGVYYNCTGLISIEIPANVKAIYPYAFGGCSNLKNVTLNEGLEVIGYCAFNNTAIEEIVIPKSVWLLSFDKYTNEDETSACYKTKKNASAFYDSKLKKVTFTEGSTSIGFNSFWYCKSLKEVIIPDTVTDIKAGAFRDCTGLAYIKIPDAVKSIGNDAFNGCSSLTNVYYSGYEEQLDLIAVGTNNAPFLNATFNFGHTHTLADWVIDCEPTCTAEGKKYSVCSECGYSKCEAIAMIAHNYSETEIVAPTYIQSGNKIYTCECGDTYTKHYSYALCDINKDGLVNEDDLDIYNNNEIPDDFDVAVLDFDSDGEQSTFDTQIFTRLANGIDMDVMADANGDGKTSLADMLRIKRMLADSAVLGNADFNGTGGVDADDLAFAKRFLLMVR